MNNHDNIKKIALAYSGGLDTSIIIPWLKENYNNPEIIAVAGNVGQADELEGLEAKAIATGASKLIVADLVDEMVDEVIIPALKMDAKYETYLLGTAFARPVIGKKLAEIALAEGADAICHGAVKAGETSRQAIARELYEETGIQAEPEEFELLDSDRERNIFYDHYCLFRRIPLKSIVLQPGETDNVMWASFGKVDWMIRTGKMCRIIGHQFYRQEKALRLRNMPKFGR